MRAMRTLRDPDLGGAARASQERGGAGERLLAIGGHETLRRDIRGTNPALVLVKANVCRLERLKSITEMPHCWGKANLYPL
jgi:hypothetical protein